MTENLTAITRRAEQKLPLPAVGIVLLAAAAYHYSLFSLGRGLTLQTPLAYVALVPPIALLLAWLKWRQEPSLSGMRGLALDFPLSRLLGLALIGAAVVLALLVPLSVRYWLLRVDLIGLPLFVAGLVTLMYGVRRLWLLRLPIAFLLLAWPVLYLPLVGQLMSAFTDMTVAGVALLNTLLPLAEVGSNGVFFVSHGGHAYPLVVGSACAGVNGLVGFGLIGVALGSVVRGPLRRRVAWLAVGLLIVWLFNVLRIEAIFAVGGLFGRQAALDILHPVAGLVVFNIGVVAMIAAVPRFGLDFVALPKRSQAGPGPGGPPGGSVRISRRGLALGALALVAALVLTAVNASYGRYELIASGLGMPRIGGLDTSSSYLDGWASGFVANFDGGRQFYGDSSTWRRVQYVSTASANLGVDRPIYLDVITTDDWQALTAYGLEACYQFHGYRIHSQFEAELPGGVTASVINYRNPKAATDWSAVYWEWPSQVDGQVRYERVVIFLADGPQATFRGVDAPAGGDSVFGETNAFLVAMASSMVARHLENLPPVAVPLDSSWT